MKERRTPSDSRNVWGRLQRHKCKLVVFRGTRRKIIISYWLGKIEHKPIVSPTSINSINHHRLKVIDFRRLEVVVRSKMPTPWHVPSLYKTWIQTVNFGTDRCVPSQHDCESVRRWLSDSALGRCWSALKSLANCRTTQDDGELDVGETTVFTKFPSNLLSGCQDGRPFSCPGSGLGFARGRLHTALRSQRQTDRQTDNSCSINSKIFIFSVLFTRL